MARGWESKEVQSQIEAARERRSRTEFRLTPEQAAAEAKRDSLLLQRIRVLRDFQNCTDPRYRKTLSDGLAYLEAQLTVLGWRPE
jgi:hypothetical protein